MDDVGDPGGERRVAGRVVAVVRADDDERDWLVGDPGDGIDQPFGFGGAALPVGDQHALTCHDEQVGGRELLSSGVEVLVGVDVIDDLDRAGEVARLQSALRGVGRADHGRLTCDTCGDAGEKGSCEQKCKA